MEYVTATELAVWADRAAARGLLPELVGMLVAASIEAKDLQENDFPTEEGTNSGGWDGHTQTLQKHTYIPTGIGGWEMGCNKGYKAKAESDYVSRTEAIDEKERKKTNFVFVTPRRWSSKKQWVQDKAKLKEWKSVRALDAEDIVKWCMKHPSVTLWLKEKINGKSDEATSGKDRLRYTTSSLTIDLPSKFITSGREAEMKELALLLSGDSGFSCTVHSQSMGESELFVLSVINNLPSKSQEEIMSRTIIVETNAEFLKLIKQQENLVLVPTFQSPNASLAVSAGHSVIIPRGRTSAPSPTAINLPLLNTDVAAEALKEEFDDFNKAHEMAQLCKLSYSAFLRRLSEHPELRLAHWVKDQTGGPELVPALQAGIWRDDNEQDKKVIEELSGMPYDKYISKLQAWSLDEDPPIAHRGNTWRVVDVEDASRLLAAFTTKQQYDLFGKVYTRIISSEDPAFDLPANERWTANVMGYSRPYSNELMEGMASSLARIVSMNEDGVITGYASYQDWANYLVKQVLDEVNKDKTGKKWYSIQHVLTILAETAPEIFLEAVEKALKDPAHVLKTMFVNDDDMFTSSPHTQLLFALETLAWSDDYLPRVSLCLAGLAELDPGGKVANRPFSSLHNLLSIIMPQSNMSQETRLAILDLVSRKYPDTGRKLALSLIPDNHESYIQKSPPTFRRAWYKEGRKSITYVEMYSNISAIVDRIIALFQDHEDETVELVSILDQLPAADYDKILAFLSGIDLNKISETSRNELWSKIRKQINRHREFPDAKWSYPSEKIDALEVVYRAFTPNDVYQQVGWLFTRSEVAILDPDGHNWQRNGEIAASHRDEAVKSIYESEGLNGIKNLANKVDDAFLIGYALNKLGDDEETSLLGLLNSENNKLKELIKGYTYKQSQLRGVEFVSKVLETNKDWTSDQISELLKSSPSSKELWEIVAAQLPEVQKAYWSQASPYGLGAEFESYPYMAEQFLKYDRPYEAIAAINYSEKHMTEVSSQLILDTLDKLKSTSPEDIHVSDNMVSYYVEEVLKVLSTRKDVKEDTLVSLQISYFPILREARGSATKELQVKFSKDPELFVELLCLNYYAKSAPRKTKTRTSDETQKKAMLAHKIIEGMHTLPGLQKDGSVDYDNLKRWTDKVMERVTEEDRNSVGKHELGAFIYRASMADKAEEWPREEVCRLLDEIDSDRFVEGFLMQAFNYDGVRFVSLEDTDELDHASGADKRASEISTLYPQAARILRKVSAELKSKRRRLFRED